MLVQLSSNQTGVLLYGDGAMFGSWDIDLVDNGNSTVSPEVNVHHTLDQSATSSLKIPTDGTVHLLEISMIGTTAAFSLDGGAVETQTTQVALAAFQNLSFGASSKVVIDELRIFKDATW
jgi:hypothetical protein